MPVQSNTAKLLPLHTRFEHLLETAPRKIFQMKPVKDFSQSLQSQSPSQPLVYTRSIFRVSGLREGGRLGSHALKSRKEVRHPKLLAHYVGTVGNPPEGIWKCPLPKPSITSSLKAHRHWGLRLRSLRSPVLQYGLHRIFRVRVEEEEGCCFL